MNDLEFEKAITETASQVMASINKGNHAVVTIGKVNGIKNFVVTSFTKEQATPAPLSIKNPVVKADRSYFVALDKAVCAFSPDEGIDEKIVEKTLRRGY